MFSGIALNMEKPFSIGDWIKVHGRTPLPEHCITACVVDIGWRTTRLRTTENSIVIIPNSMIAEQIVTNYMLPGEVSRFSQFFIIDFSVPSERVIEIMTEALMSLVGPEAGLLKEPKSKARVNRTTTMGIEYEVRYFVIPRSFSPSKARNAVNAAVVEYLDKAGIRLAYPISKIARLSSKDIGLSRDLKGNEVELDGDVDDPYG
jgi:branched-chain amino acid transport system substrate-binding protein